MTLRSFIFKGVLPLLVLAGGVYAWTWFMSNPEEASKRPRPEAAAYLVETGMPDSGDYPVRIEVLGQVEPSQSVALKPQVGGEIVHAGKEFVPGGQFRAGQTILRIEPRDYELQVEKQEAVLQQARADHELEMGRQSIARNELEIVAETTGEKIADTALALRKPQLQQAEAEIAKARADLATAKLNLERTVVKAPFNALVTERMATQGTRVTAQETVATLVNTDEYWVSVSVPVDALKWLRPQGGDAASDVTVYMDGGRGERSGYLHKMTGMLDNQSRMAGLTLAVPDPLLISDKDAAGRSPLILGDYVRTEISGRMLQGVVRIPVAWLRDNATVWVAGKDGKMHIRDIELLHSDRDYAYIADGLSAGEEVVTSDVPVPVDGMKIRKRGDVLEAPPMETDEDDTRDGDE